VAPGAPVTFSRTPAPEGWLVDGDAEGPLAEHRAAHAAGRPSEAAVAYGAGVPPEATADRLLALAELARDTGLLRAVCPVPAEGSPERPGSWGVEDLTVVAAARLALPEAVRVRPHWRRLGPAACQVATAFGATDWVIPADDDTDAAHLAAAVGREAVAR
jgi:2-iminoacetate synthase ThiH